jgi:O-antigen ligase
MEKFFYLFVFVVPYLPPPMMFVVPLQAIFGAIFAFWLLVRSFLIRSWRMSPVIFCFWFLFAWLIAADLLNLARIGTWQELRHTSGRLVFLVVTMTSFSVVKDPAHYRRVLKIMMASVVLLAAFTIFCAITNYDPFQIMPRRPREFWGTSMVFRRTTGLDMSYGLYGIIINSVLPLFLLSFWQKDFLIKKKWAALGILVLMAGLFISQSRNSWLATFVMLTFLASFLSLQSRNPFLKLMVIFGAGLTMLIAVAWGAGLLKSIFAGFALGRQATTFYRRLYIDQIVLDLFTRHWMFGVGHEAVTQEITRKVGMELVVHNGYLDQLASNGIFGFLPFISVMLLSLGVLWRMARKGLPRLQPYALCLACSLVANMSILLAYKGFFAVTLAIEYGLMLSLVEFNERKVPQEVPDVEVFSDLPPDHYLVRPGWK